MKRLFLSLLTVFMSFQHMSAQSDSIRISLLTCEPGSSIYELYGHTAIRVQDFINGRDIVFNYGLFDFSTPHFIWRFSLGQTDYLLGAGRIGPFMDEYDARGSKIWSQELNLTSQENVRLYSLLLENSLPQNREYRYNFLYGNCATMALDKIEESISGIVRYPQPANGESFRSILTRHTCVKPWSQFAVDLVVGAEADRPLQYRQDAFAPQVLMDMAARATITDTAGIARPLVLPATELVRPNHEVDFGKAILTPLQVMWIFLIFTVLICLLSWYSGHALWMYDAIIYGIQGIAGLVIAFLFFISEHPAVDTNWLITILNPLPLLFIPVMIRHFRRKQMDWFLMAEFIVCAAFAATSHILPQYIEPAMTVYSSALAVRALSSSLFLFSHSQKSRNRGKKGPHKATVTLLLAFAPLFSEAKTANPPRLVVGIVIDQLDGDYLQQLLPCFRNDGLKKLWYDGYTRSTVNLEFDSPDLAASVAAIHTGASPFQNGIVAGRWMNRNTLTSMPVVDDSRYMGSGTIECTSPSRLLASNIADELKLATQGRAKVCSIAIERDAAVLAAGHEADVAVWMNPSNCQWCSSDYYGIMPAWIQPEGPDRLHNQTWEPKYPTGYYIQKSEAESYKSFSHTLRQTNATAYRTSPAANDRVTDLALQAIDAMSLGRDNTTDMLLMTLYAGNFEHTVPNLWSLEQQDIYLRIDDNIATLVNTIDSSIGNDNVLYFITSTGYMENSPNNLASTRIPTGTVSMERLTALLRLYLSAKFDCGNLVEAYYRNHIYLNHRLMEDKNLELHSVLESCVDLLVQASGVSNVILLRNLMSVVPDAESVRIRNSLNPAFSGDIMIQVLPGWILQDENEGLSIGRKRPSFAFPVILYGAGVRNEINHEPIQSGFLASTVSYIMRCDQPNACHEAPLKGIMQ